MATDEPYVSDEELIAQAEMSPCVGVCKKDDNTGWCFGCGRTDDEIENWQAFDAAKKQTLEAELPDRVKQLIERRRAERGGSSRRTRRKA